jgi:hypothetical protein
MGAVTRKPPLPIISMRRFATHGARSDRNDRSRRFPPPWSIKEYNDACFIVRDSNGQQLAYVYFEADPAGRSTASWRFSGRGRISRTC